MPNKDYVMLCYVMLCYVTKKIKLIQTARGNNNSNNNKHRRDKKKKKKANKRTNKKTSIIWSVFINHSLERFQSCSTDFARFRSHFKVKQP